MDNFQLKYGNMYRLALINIKKDKKSDRLVLLKQVISSLHGNIKAILELYIKEYNVAIPQQNNSADLCLIYEMIDKEGVHYTDFHKKQALKVKANTIARTRIEFNLAKDESFLINIGGNYKAMLLSFSKKTENRQMEAKKIKESLLLLKESIPSILDMCVMIHNYHEDNIITHWLPDMIKKKLIHAFAPAGDIGILFSLSSQEEFNNDINQNIIFNNVISKIDKVQNIDFKG